MPINSRAKGCRGEREIAKKLREYGYDCRRGQQYSGSETSADIVGLPGIHPEVKFVEKFSLYDALAQAKRDTGSSGDLPAVFHRRKEHSWVVVMELSDWITLYRDYEIERSGLERWTGEWVTPGNIKIGGSE